MKNIREIIQEELIGYMMGTSGYNKNNKYTVYKNPLSINKMEEDLRGIISEYGDLFVIDGNNILHDDLYRFLLFRNEIKQFNNIYVMRDGKTDNFYLSERYYSEKHVNNIFNGKYDIETSYNKIIEILKKCKNKNPRYNIIPRTINNKNIELLKSFDIYGDDETYN